MILNSIDKKELNLNACIHSENDKRCKLAPLRGFKLCIKHIWDLPNPPFKQCLYIQKKSGRRCRNVVYNQAQTKEQKEYCKVHGTLMGFYDSGGNGFFGRGEAYINKNDKKRILEEKKKGKSKEFKIMMIEEDKKRKKFIENLSNTRNSRDSSRFKPSYIPTAPLTTASQLELANILSQKPVFAPVSNYTNVELDNFENNNEFFSNEKSTVLYRENIGDEFFGNRMNPKDYIIPMFEPNQESVILSNEELVKMRINQLDRLEELYKEQYINLTHILAQKNTQYLLDRAEKLEERARFVYGDAANRLRTAYDSINVGETGVIPGSSNYNNEIHAASFEEALAGSKSFEKKISKEDEIPIVEKTDIPGCIFRNEENKRCNMNCFLGSNHCFAHILKDENQQLFSGCRVVMNPQLEGFNKVPGAEFRISEKEKKDQTIILCNYPTLYTTSPCICTYHENSMTKEHITANIEYLKDKDIHILGRKLDT